MSDIAQPQDSIELMQARAETMRRATEIAVRLGVLTIFVALCLQILAPFVGIVAWGLIIAIAVTGPYEAVVKKMGSRRGLTATLFILLALALVIIPAADKSPLKRSTRLASQRPNSTAVCVAASMPRLTASPCKIRP